MARSVNNLIGRAEVAAAMATAQQARQELYSRRMDEFIQNGMLTAVAEMTLQIESGADADGSYLTMAADRIAARVSGDATAIEQRLLHTGFYWNTEPDKWEYGIPSLANHARRRAIKNTVTAIASSNTNTVLAKLVEMLPSGRMVAEEDLQSALAVEVGNDVDVGFALELLKNLGYLIPAFKKGSTPDRRSIAGPTGAGGHGKNGRH